MRNLQKNHNIIWQLPISRQTPHFALPPPFLAKIFRPSPFPSILKTLNLIKGGGVKLWVDLPNDRTLDEPPFMNCGLDMFGPFLIKEARNKLKRYVTLLTLSVHAAWIQIR